MNARPADPLAIRVSRRHAARDQPAAIVPTTTGLNVGTIYAIEAKMMVEPATGWLRNFTFLATEAGSPTTIRWEGVGEDDELVTGKLVLHATVGEDEVTCWAEVVVDR